VSQDRASELLSRRQLAGHDLGHPLVNPGNRFLDDQVEQVFLALEVMVEAALQDTDRVGDILDRGGVIALRLEHLRRRRDDFREVCYATAILAASAPRT